MSAFSLINAVFNLLSSLIAWGQARNVFKANEAIIVSRILENAVRDIQLAKEIHQRLDDAFRDNPASIVQSDEFTIPDDPGDKQPDTTKPGN